jgi:hypothetical protein
MDEIKSEDCGSDIAGEEHKEQRQIRIDFSFLNYQILFESSELIHNNDWIKMLRLAEPI